MKFVYITDMPWMHRFGNFIYHNFPIALSELQQEVEVYAPLRDEIQMDNRNLVVYPLNKFGDKVDGDVLCLFLTPGVSHWDGGQEKLRELLPALKGRFRKIVYWAADCWTTFHLSDDWLLMERVFVENSNIHMANSPQTCVRLQRVFGLPRVWWLPNAIPNYFISLPHPPAEDVSLSSLQSPEGKFIVSIVGFFFGARRVDELLAVAPEFRDLVFVLVGSVDRQFPIYSHAVGGNLFYVGEQDNEFVTKLLSTSLFAIVAAGWAWFSYFADPTKWYVYHAHGVPILSLNTPHHKKYPHIYPYTICASSYKEGIEKMLSALVEGRLPLRYQPLKWHTYYHRAKAFLGILEGGNPYGAATDTGEFVLGEYTRWED